MIRTVQGTIPGRDGIGPIYLVEGDTHLGAWIEKDGRLDHDLYLLPKITAMIKPGDCVVDGGACTGDHTAAYGVAACAGVVHAFEPGPDSCACLRANVQHLGNVIVHEMGLGAHHGVMRWVQQANTGASYLSQYAEQIGDLVPVIALDSLGLSPALIKLDIEGYEVQALRGAERTIARCRPILVLEVNHNTLEASGTSARELADLLASWRYDCRDIHSGELFAPDDGRPMYDIVCRP